jgi:hypothetical protein
MDTRVIASQISPRELWIAKAELDMPDASRAEIAKCCFLICGGMSRDDAKQQVLAQRKTPGSGKDEKIFSLRLPAEWVDAAKANMPDLSDSQLFRYVVAAVATDDDDQAMQIAVKKRGRPVRNRESAA